MPSRRPLFSALALPVALLLALFGAAAATAATPRPTHVKASLVAADAAVVPGRPLLVALRLVHDPHWHTYWLNPGTGLPTTIAWKLPPGWTAGPIQWPAPQILRDAKKNIVGNGYEGDLLLPITLTPPADLAAGTTVELRGDADWLMCEEVCIPGGGPVALTLPVAAAGASPAPDAAWGEKLRAVVAALPRADAAWKLAAARPSPGTVRLTVTPAAAGAPAPKSPHFFSADGHIVYDVPQVFTAGAGGSFTLDLPVDANGPANVSALTGVLTTAGSWSASAALPGLAVNLPLPALTAAQLAALAAKTAGAAPAPGAVSPLSTFNSQPQPAPGGLLGTLALAFVGGLILNLMPCVFPVLGIKILGFVNQAGHQRAKIVAHGLTFTGGVLLSFWSLATVLAVLRAGGDQLGWGFQLQSAPFVFSLAVLLLVFGLNMSGLFEFGLGATAVGGELQMKSGYAGSFFTGVLATVVATPCSAPFLAPALGAALAVSTVESFAIFTSIGIGLSTPYLLLSIFPQAVKVLPRPGAWMETFKQFMAFPLYATVGYLLWVLAAQTSDEGFLNVIFSLVLVALAVWIYGRWTAPGAKPARVRFGVAGLIVVGALGLWVGWPRAVLAGPAAPGVAPAVTWDAWSPEAVAKLRAEGRIIYVDFTARWCATCQTNKKIVFGSGDVLRTFAEKKIATLRADWTNKDPRITAELAAYQRSAVPFNLVYLPGKDAPIILPELLTPSIVLDAVAGK
jgi:thiol:disulfide interchange protein DsbD